MRMFVNIYEVGRGYGGPEEGGWYFDYGSPIGSIPVELTDDERTEVQLAFDVAHGIEEATTHPQHYTDEYTEAFRSALMEKARRIRDQFIEQYPDTGKRGSVLGGDDWSVVIEDHFARPYPQERPFYE